MHRTRLTHVLNWQSACLFDYSQVSYRILGRGYFSVSLFAGNKYTEIEGRGSHLK